VFKHNAIKMQGGVKEKLHVFLTFVLNGGERSSTLRQLCLRERKTVSTDSRPGGSQSRSGPGVEEKESQRLTRIEP
jgi:hypothetical protein